MAIKEKVAKNGSPKVKAESTSEGKNAGKKLIELTSEEALDLFMTDGVYHDVELPGYFNFDEVLAFVRKKVGSRTLDECCVKGRRPEDMQSSVNLDILMNKDGKYGVRPLTIINPYLYYMLARLLCEPKNWRSLRHCFRQYEASGIQASAMPIVRAENEDFHNSTTILNWWRCVEQKSIELSLEYKYMFMSDITNCYGCISPQSISWALSMKDTDSETRRTADLSEGVVRLLSAMQNGRSVGLPQAGSLFHLIAEAVLGYADMLLVKRLQELEIEDYEVIRYRDDYRIFSNSKEELVAISYELQHVLGRLGFMMNSQKTKLSSSLVIDSIKPEKLDYIAGTPIIAKDWYNFGSLQKHMLFIYMFAQKHPNCGQIKNLLGDFDRRLKKQFPEWYERDDGPQIVAIAARLAMENVSVSHYALRTISLVLSKLQDDDLCDGLVDKVQRMLEGQPNSSYMQIWLQNITYQRDFENRVSPYDMPLCCLAMGEDVELWNLDWLKADLRKGLPMESICDMEQLKKTAPVIVIRKSHCFYDFDVPDFDEPDFDEPYRDEPDIEDMMA